MTTRTARLAPVAGIVLLLAAGPLPATSTLQSLSAELQAIVARVSPSVVQVLTTGHVPGGSLLAPSGELLTRHASGSGVIVDADGYIVTNAHVIEGARRVQVLLATPGGSGSVLQPRGRLLGAQVVAIDHETDLAVLKVREQGLPALAFGDSERLRQGQLVLAFGSPMGLENTVTLGAVSARARQLAPEDPMIYVQTDATINPGNSGGPLVDTDGRIVGINTFILSQSGGSEGLGFAAPSNIVRTIFEQIRSSGRVRRGVIGVRAQTLTPAVAAGLRIDRVSGVILADVHPEGPAARAGLVPGDVIIELNGKVMENGRQFTVNLYGLPIGQLARIGVLRDGELRTIDVTVVERRDDPTRFVELVDPERNLVRPLGVLCLEIDERVERLIPRPRRPARVIVAARAPEAPYWEGGFEPGDILHSMNGLPVTGLDALRARVGALQPGDAVVFHIERDGELLFVAFRL